MKRNELERLSCALRTDILARLSQYDLSSSDCEDFAQDAMMKLWLLREKINDERHALALGYRIVRHLVLNKVKRRRLFVEDVVMENKESELRADSPILEKENDLWLERQMKILPPTERQILVLRQKEQMTTEEIAVILGIKKESVITLLSRARKRLIEWRKN